MTIALITISILIVIIASLVWLLCKALNGTRIK